MLHDFISENRNELIQRCRAKVRNRDSPPVTPRELQHGVPLFLEQLVDALRHEQSPAVLDSSATARPGAALENRRTAALHGKELLEDGYSVDQVVHGYGDICQSVTELAKEHNAPITVVEFHTFNRLLDNAIADAVSSYAHQLVKSANLLDAEDLHGQLGNLAEELSLHLQTALKALDALKVGNIGLMGATGMLLEDSLIHLRALIDKSFPEIRLSTGMTRPGVPGVNAGTTVPRNGGWPPPGANL